MTSLCCKLVDTLEKYLYSNFQLKSNRIKVVSHKILSNNAFMKCNHIYELTDLLEILN